MLSLFKRHLDPVFPMKRSLVYSRKHKKNIDGHEACKGTRPKAIHALNPPGRGGPTRKMIRLMLLREEGKRHGSLAPPKPQHVSPQLHVHPRQTRKQGDKVT